jgi:integrase
MVEAERHAMLIGRPAPGKTLGDLLRRYAEVVVEGKRGGRWESFRLLAVARDKIGDVSLEKLSSQHLSDWRDRRLKEVSAASVDREITIISAAFTKAIKEWCWLKENPMRNVQRPQTPPARTRRISDDELEKLLFVLGYDRESKPEMVQARIGAALLFTIETAMRAGEICGLTWARVDTGKRLAHLDKTKNGHPRDVPLSREALRIIEQLRGVDDVLVFALSTAQLDALFRKARDRAMIEGLHFHDSRREALTRLAAKVDVMTLAKISGHRDLRILSNTYYAPDMSAVADKLD